MSSARRRDSRRGHGHSRRRREEERVEGLERRVINLSVRRDERDARLDGLAAARREGLEVLERLRANSISNTGFCLELSGGQKLVLALVPTRVSAFFRRCLVVFEPRR